MLWKNGETDFHGVEKWRKWLPGCGCLQVGNDNYRGVSPPDPRRGAWHDPRRGVGWTPAAAGDGGPPMGGNAGVGTKQAGGGRADGG